MTDKQQDMPPWLQPVLEQDDDAGFKSDRIRLAVAIGATILIATFIVILAFVYIGSDDEAARGPVQVKAPDGPVKERPADPGGMTVEDRDKQVFNRLNGTDSAGTQQIGDTPEEPLAEIPAGDRAKLADAVDAIAKDPASVKQIPDSKGDKPRKLAESLEKALVIPDVKKTVKAAGQYKVQLGAFSTRAGAERAWKNLKRKYADKLADLSPEYHSLARSGGSLVRLRVGTIPDRAAADRMCLALKADGQGCIVVAP